MDNKSKLKTELKAKLKQEMSVTGTGASVTPGTGEGVATKYAFGKRDNKGTPKDWKSAPSIPNRKSKAMDYKELWEGLEVDDRVKVVYGNEFFGETGTVVDIVKGFAVIEMDRDGKEYSMHVSDVEKIDDEDDMLQEGYAQFRNETKMRSKPDQFHQAVKQIKRKMNEINRIFEYVDRLKSELSEGEDLKYKKYTENAFQQIKESAKQLFLKSTKLK